MSQSGNQAKILFGRLLCGIGIVLGMVGYALGTRWLGTLAIILAILTLAIGLFLGQSVLPGAYDRITSGLTR